MQGELGLALALALLGSSARAGELLLPRELQSEDPEVAQLAERVASSVQGLESGEVRGRAELMATRALVLVHGLDDAPLPAHAVAPIWRAACEGLPELCDLASDAPLPALDLVLAPRRAESPLAQLVHAWVTRSPADMQGACELGSSRACMELTHPTPDQQERACLEGWAAGCLQWGERSSPPLAAALARLACDFGAMEGCTRLALAYREGMGLKTSEDDADTLLDQACSQGHGPACYQRATPHERAGPRLDLGLALDDYLRGCALGDGPSCFRAGALHLELRLGDEAVSNWGTGCRTGYLPACEELSRLVDPQSGARPNADLHADALANACLIGELRLCVPTAQRYQHGLWVRSDPGRAAALYTQACEGGITRGCRAGLRIATDPELKERLLHTLSASCEGGDKGACRVRSRHDHAQVPVPPPPVLERDEE